MKHSAKVIWGWSLMALVGCKAQRADEEATRTNFVEPKSVRMNLGSSLGILPPSTQIPPQPSIASLSQFKPVGVLTLPFYTDVCNSPVFSPDGKWIAAAGFGLTGEGAGESSPVREAGLVFLWDARTRVLVKKLATPKAKIRWLKNLIWSPDSRQIAAWSDSSSVSLGAKAPLHVWDVRSGAVLNTYENGELTATSACFLSNEQLLISWFNHAQPQVNEGRVTLAQSGNQETVKFRGHSVSMLMARKNAPPLALILNQVGEIPGLEPLFKTEICEWKNDGFGTPLVAFEAGEAMFAMALSNDQRF